MDWADQPSPRPHAPRAVDPVPHGDLTKSDLAEAVARELGFGACRTADALARRWRAYVWRNHPDRQPQHGREHANARVAVANALYDSARRALRRV